MTTGKKSKTGKQSAILAEGRIIGPGRKANNYYRSREYLTEIEIQRLLTASSKSGRNPKRDTAIILLGYRHGLRVSELINLRWDQVDLEMKQIHVSRVKNGNPSVQPLADIEIELLSSLKVEAGMQVVFLSERKRPLTADAVRKIIRRVGEAAGITAVHPHMLRHACGFKLAQDGQDTRAIQDYLGHRNIQHTVRYTQLTSDRFKTFFQ